MRRTPPNTAQTPPYPSMVAPAPQTADAGGSQLTFGALTIDEPHRPAGPNRRKIAARAADRTIRAADRTGEHVDPDRAEARDQVAGHLLTWLRKLEPGDDFQAADWHNWMVAHDLYPRPDVYSPRAAGNLWRRLVSAGVIDRIGYRANAGCPERNTHATTRPVYRLLRAPTEEDLG